MSFNNLFTSFGKNNKYKKLDYESPPLNTQYDHEKSSSVLQNAFTASSTSSGSNSPYSTLRYKKNNVKRMRYTRTFMKRVLLALFALFIFILSYKSMFKSRLLNISETQYSSQKDSPFKQGCNNIKEYLANPDYEKQKATFVMLTRNQEIEDVIKTLENIEIRFNQWFQYPYVFLNDEPFDELFQNEVLKTVSVDISKVKFGVLDVEKEWNFKGEDQLDKNQEINVSLKDQEDRGLLYGGLKSYHKMCRFYSGFFQDNELLKDFDYYWRIEPDVKFFCDLTYDPFYEMKKANKKYGFTILISELYWTIPSLFRYTKTFINNKIKRDPRFKVGSLWSLFIKDFKVLSVNNNKKHIQDDYNILDKFINHENDLDGELSRYVEMKHYLENKEKMESNPALKGELKKGLLETLKFAKKVPKIYDDKFFNEEFNLCHFWSNFEIASLDLFRSPTYKEYFEFLDTKSGFTKERFGDAPVHTLGLAMLLNLEDIHYFRDIAYSHSSLTHCVKNDPVTGNLKNEPGQGFVENHWQQYRYYPYSKASTIKQNTIAAFRKIMSTTKETENNVDVGCNCDCPVGYKEIEDSSRKCSSKLFEMMSDNYQPKQQVLPQEVIYQVESGYLEHIDSIIANN